jgi:hypothetical protein
MRYRVRRLGCLQLVFGALLTPALAGQGAVARLQENLRAAPNGAVLGVVRAGATLSVRERRNDWLSVIIEGWIWERSLESRSQGDFDSVILVTEGENLRTEPSGSIVAHLASGTALIELERRPGWIRVRRPGWIWAQSVDQQAQASGSGRESSARSASRPSDASAPAARDSLPGEDLHVGGRGVALLDGPDGDTLARAFANSRLRVTARNGDWAQVRVEGWVWVPGSDSAASLVEDEAISPAQVAADPARYVGRVIRWDLQFISLERAEPIRTDFRDGEPFLLTRPTTGDRFFIYVAVPPEQVARLGSLVPLEEIRVVGRVRTGASALTGSPVIELMELQGRRPAVSRE